MMEEFRQRQHHEQGYRVEVHDLFLNAARCGYDKDSPDRKRPRFCRGPLQMIGCLAGLLYNACADFAAKLGSAWEGAQIRTLRRTFFNRPGTLYCTPTSVIVYSRKGRLSMSPTVPPTSVMTTSSPGFAELLEPPLDLIGDVRDHLHCRPR